MRKSPLEFLWKYGLAVFATTFIFSLDWEVGNYLLAIVIIYLIQTRDEDNFFYALIIALSSVNHQISINTQNLNVASSQINYNVNLGFFNISLPEVFYLTVVLLSFRLMDNRFFNTYKAFLILLLVGGIYVAYRTLTYPLSVITGWSAAFRVTLVPFALLAGLFVNKNFGSLSPYKFLSAVILVFLINAFFFNRFGHLIFLAAACISATIFFSKLAFFILTALFAFSLFRVGESTTFTVILSYVIPLVLYVSRAASGKFYAKSTLIGLIMAFVSLFAYVLWNLEEIYTYFFQTNEDFSSIFDDPKTYFIFKMGDRVALWKPFLDDFLLHPYEMVFNRPLSILNILFDESKETEWKTHPHNVFIGLLYFYGPVIGGFFIFLLLKVIRDSINTISSLSLPKSVFFNGLILSMLPGLLFGFYPIEFTIGYIYFLIAGSIIFSDENIAYRLR